MSKSVDEKLFEESSLGGWWAGACLSVAGLILMWAGLVQQTNQVSKSIGLAFGIESKQANWIEPTQFVRSEQTYPIAEPVDGFEQSAALTSSANASEEVDSLDQDAMRFGAKNITPEVDSTAAREPETAAEDEPVTQEQVAEVVEPFIAPAPEPVIEDEPVAQDQVAEVVEPVTEPEPEVITEPVVTEIAGLTDQRVSPVDAEPAQPIVESEPEGESVLSILRRTALLEMTDRSRNIKFFEGQVRLTDTSESLLQTIFEDLFLYSESEIVIEIANKDGTDDISNNALASERAWLIKSFLTDRGLDEERLLVSVLPEGAGPDELQHISIEAKIDE